MREGIHPDTLNDYYCALFNHEISCHDANCLECKMLHQQVMYLEGLDIEEPNLITDWIIESTKNKDLDGCYESSDYSTANAANVGDWKLSKSFRR